MIQFTSEQPKKIVRLELRLDKAITLPAFFWMVNRTLVSMSSLYTKSVLIAAGNFPRVLDHYGQYYAIGTSRIPPHGDSVDLDEFDFAHIFESDKQQLEQIHVEPLRIAHFRYGSPAVVDLLGIGKVIEVLEHIVKEILWLGSHEKKMAERERNMANLQEKLGEEELAKARLENEGKRLEIAKKGVELLKEIRGLEVSEQQKWALATVLLPDVKRIASRPEDFRVVLTEDYPNPRGKIYSIEGVDLSNVMVRRINKDQSTDHSQDANH